MVLILAALLFNGTLSSAGEKQGSGFRLPQINLPTDYRPTLPTIPSAPSNPIPSSAPGTDLACHIAGAFRLTLDSMKCNCYASQSTQGGSIPDDVNCNSPAQTLANSSNTGANYKLGARPSLGPIVDPAPQGSVDCSGFISAGLCRAGTPFKPNSNGKCEDMTTKAMLDAIEKGDSCFTPIPSGRQKPVLQGGEIVVYPHAGGDIGHVFAVDRVSSNCNNLSIIQSASSKSGVGITTLNGPTARSDDQGMAEDALLKLNCGESGGDTGKIKIVHFDENKPGCKQQTGNKLKNESCVSSCKVGTMRDHDG